jgi:hypothetical protein
MIQDITRIFKGSLEKANLEWIIYFFLAIVLNFSFFIYLGLQDDHKPLDDDFKIARLIDYHSVKIITAGIILIFPIIYKLIFEVLPIKGIGIWFKETRKKEKIQSENRNTKNSEKENKEVNTPKLESIPVSKLEYMEQLAQNAEKFARKLFLRSGVYLLIGSMIALIGITYFSIQRFDVSENEKTTEIFLLYLPRFGALFFTEFIAFFFLKQYRITMEDYKYYETIKRQYEYNLFKLKFLLQESEVKTEIIDKIFNSLDFELMPNKLLPNQSTESLESRKYSNEELKIFEKIIENIKPTKN